MTDTKASPSSISTVDDTSETSTYSSDPNEPRNERDIRHYNYVICSCIRSGDTDVVKYLVEHKKTNINDHFYELPLKVAVETNNMEMIKYLIKNGANPNEFIGFGDTPFTLAKSPEIIKYLIDNGADPLQSPVREYLAKMEIYDQVKDYIIKLLKKKFKQEKK